MGHARAWLLAAVLGAILAFDHHNVRSLSGPPGEPGLWTVERSRQAAGELGPGARCRIEHGFGEVSIRRSDDRIATVAARVRCAADDASTAARSAHRTRVELSVTRSGVLVTSPRDQTGGVVVDLDVTLPAGVPIDVRTAAGRVVLDRVGPAVVKSTAGAIDLTSPAGPFELATQSGPISVRLLREPRQEARIRTLTGSIAVKAHFDAPMGRGGEVTYPMTILARSEHGRLRVARPAGEGPKLHLDSVDGDIDVESIW